MNGVRAGLDEWSRENAKDEEGGRLSARLTRGRRGRIAEWMALFMRTDFCSDVAATLIGRERKDGCRGRVDEADERAIVESAIG